MNLYQQCQHMYHKRLGKGLFWGVNAVLLLLLVSLASRQIAPVWHSSDDVEATSTPAQPLIRPVSTVNQTRVIAGKHLFGEAPVPAEAVVATNITVFGIFLADDPKRSSAVLSVDNAPEDNFWPGDTLPGGGKVVEILFDRVIIQQNGQRQEVLFDTDVFPNTGVAPTPRAEPSRPRTPASEWRERRRQQFLDRLNRAKATQAMPPDANDTAVASANKLDYRHQRALMRRAG